MADSSILSDFGINILEQEIDDVIFQTNEFLCDATFTGSQGPFWWLLVVAVTNSSRYGFNRCKSTTCKFLSRDTKSARDKNGTKPRKNKVKNTSPEISLVEYLCFVCKGTNLSLEKRGEIPISLIHNSFSYHCTPNVVFANGFDLKQRLLEDHRKENKDILIRHFYDMSNMMSRNEGVWLSNGWVKTLLWSFCCVSFIRSFRLPILSHLI